MIARAGAILLSVLAAMGLWFGYDNLTLMRGTVLWEFRYVVFAVAAFLGLSGLEWAWGRIVAKLQDPDH